MPLISLQLIWARMKYVNYAPREHKREEKKKEKNIYLQNNKKTKKDKSSTKVIRAHGLSLLYTFWHVNVNFSQTETPCVREVKHTALFCLTELLRAKPNIK